MNNELAPEMDLAEQIFVLLREQPEGCSEYQLIQQLKARHSTHIPHLPLFDKLVLFRTHFLVFNALYRLRDHLWQQTSHSLQISPLCIQLQPYVAAADGVCEPDPLRAYYLDMNHLRDTDEEEVERLLASFWSRMRGDHQGEPREAWTPDQKRAALELFDLQQEDDSSLTLNAIKRRYRQLVSIHHPDRGGSTTRIQSINLAMEILQRYYR
ncbi:MAG: molecular chaperone DnaJ [Pseudomonas stutzeri]|nr:molecular chaperone DnaJ [Stutzerimonas stutzeri]